MNGFSTTKLCHIFLSILVKYVIISIVQTQHSSMAFTSSISVDVCGSRNLHHEGFHVYRDMNAMNIFSRYGDDSKNNRFSTNVSTLTYMTKTDGDNFEELLRAARDPKSFEDYVSKQQQLKNIKTQDTTVSTQNKQEDEGQSVRKKKGYVPIEEWDEERSKDSMSWENKVQFDGQRFGNQFQQNEILRKNLKSW
mmetsp:Transcript_23380/g.28723  ORF Transcript_23380/g.28723 Transcript_23380/m.28723 type:complete len:194 (+) Transcript_23380:144-725(+)